MSNLPDLGSNCTHRTKLVAHWFLFTPEGSIGTTSGGDFWDWKFSLPRSRSVRCAEGKQTPLKERARSVAHNRRTFLRSDVADVADVADVGRRTPTWASAFAPRKQNSARKGHATASVCVFENVLAFWNFQELPKILEVWTRGTKILDHVTCLRSRSQT